MFRTQIQNGWLIVQYLCGVSPNKLAEQYRSTAQKEDNKELSEPVAMSRVVDF